MRRSNSSSAQCATSPTIRKPPSFFGVRARIAALVAVSDVRSGLLGSLGLRSDLAGHSRLVLQMLEAAALIAKAVALAGPVAQVVELRPPRIAVAHHFDLREARRMHGEDSLDAFVGDNAPHGDHLVDPSTFAPNEHALIHLNALLVAFDDPHVYVDGVADAQLRNVGFDLLGEGFFNKFLLVHVST